MSKFLKFIVHFIVICTILCVVALAVPPFFGVTTEIRDESGTETNLPMGSVTYAIPVKTEEIAIGDPVLVNKGEAVYRYNISTINMENGTGTAIDPTVSQAQPVNVAIGAYVPKVVITIGFIGYLMVATKSIEGLIILGLAVLFLIILYVIAELWKKDPDDDDIPEDTERGYVKSKKELKREEKRRERQYREEEREIKAEGKRPKKKEKRKVRTGGFVDEIDEEDDYEEEEIRRPQRNVQTATSEAHELLKKEIAAATAEDAEPVRKAQRSRQTAQKAPAKKRAAEPRYVEEEEEPVEIKRMAVPRYSPAQLAERAKRAGDAPDIVKDEITKVTLFDYSDIFADDEDDDDLYDED